MGGISFDTTFLIDFQRERREGEGGAHAFLHANREAVAYLSVVAYAEYAEGFDDLTSPAFLSVVESFEHLGIDRGVADRYAMITRRMRAEGRLIGSNDLWIAAIALENDLPVVTAHLEHFQWVPGLQVLGYRSNRG